MNENAVGRPSMPKWIVPVLIATVIIVLFQSLFMLTISDAGIISQTKAMARAERDQKGTSSYFNSRSNEEIDQMVENRRDAVTRNFRRESIKPIILKAAFAVLILFVALGVRQRKPRPTRLLAMIAGLILVLGLVVTFSQMANSLAAYKYTDSKFIVLLDNLWYVLALLSAVACFVAFAKLKAFAVKRPGQESPKTEEPPSSPH
jgi:hypothetical protein